jgi:hypothetical protein
LLDGEDGKELVYATYEGPVHCMDLQSGRTRWSLPGDALPFSLASAAFGSGVGELVFVANAAGALTALDREGSVQWTFESLYPMYDVAPGQFCEGEKLVACGGIERTLHLLDGEGRTVSERPLEKFAHRMAAGDFDGDGLDELFLMDGRGGACMLKLEDGEFRTVWEHGIKLPDEYANWENWWGEHQSLDVHVADVDGDGRDELVLGDSFHNHQTVALVSGQGELQWISEPQTWYASDRAWFEYFSTAFVTTVPSEDDPERLNIANVTGGLVRLFGPQGKLLSSVESVLGFADIVADGRTLYLGSTPNGDDTVYRIDLQSGWEQEVAGLKARGRAGRMRRTLTRIREQARQHEGSPPAETNYHVQQFRLGEDEINQEAYQRITQAFDEQVPDAPFRHVVSVPRILEDEPVRKENGEPFNMVRYEIDEPLGTRSPDEIVALARRIEEQEIPTFFLAGHNCNPYITLDTAERMLKAAPNYLVGFGTAEDVSAETIGDYVRQFIGPLCDLCREHGGKEVMIKNKVLWWLDGPAMPTVYEELFATPRREVLVAATEESNGRWSETNLMGRLGLYYAGLVGAMKVRIIRDMFAPNCFHEYEYPRSGSPYLRMLVAHTVTGCSEFQMAISDKVSGDERDGEGFRYNLLGRESTELFQHLLSKGIVFPPRPEQMANICSTGLVMHPPPQKWLKNAHNNHRPWEGEEDEETLNAVYPRLHCGWAHAPLPEFAFSRIAFRKKRVFDCLVPATPYGHILMLPCHFDRSGIDAVGDWWHTDGIRLWREGERKMTGPEAGRALRQSLEAAAQDLPVQSVGDDVFYQLVRREEGGYRLFAVDPGCLDPADRRARFRLNLPGAWQARDVLTDGPVPLQDGELVVDVPAGAFRVVDLRKA